MIKIMYFIDHLMIKRLLNISLFLRQDMIAKANETIVQFAPVEQLSLVLAILIWHSSKRLTNPVMCLQHIRSHTYNKRLNYVHLQKKRIKGIVSNYRGQSKGCIRKQGSHQLQFLWQLGMKPRGILLDCFPTSRC